MVPSECETWTYGLRWRTVLCRDRVRFRSLCDGAPLSISIGQTKQNAIKRKRRFHTLTERDRPPTVLNEERRRAILDLVAHQGRVLVTELAHQFETSQVTIRKD